MKAWVYKLMDEKDRLAERFEEERPRLHAVALRLLGSSTEAEDAVQEAWIRLGRARVEEIQNVGAWLMTVIGHVALNMLRARSRCREAPLEERWVGGDLLDPEEESLVSESVGLALLVVLETLSPSQRLAFVLHDVFGVAFDDIGRIIRWSPEVARQHASRARQRVRRGTPTVSQDAAGQEGAAEAFFAATRQGDFNALLRVLDPDVALRVLVGPGEVVEERGADSVARRAVSFADPGLVVREANVAGIPGWVGPRGNVVVSAGSVTVRGGSIVAIDIVIDPGRLQGLAIAWSGGSA